ncbi:ribose-phosphate pyrophosphokinase 1 [Pyrenophora tritici-repentis]|nr:ribose-phosphate pyrophosphokinase 1 [Pyrenophora tritici-repentis]
MAAIALPDEPPHRMPSSEINLRAYRKDVRSSVLYHLSTIFWSKTSGMKSYPMPSTL